MIAEPLIVPAETIKRETKWGEVVTTNDGKAYKVYTCHQAQRDILESKAKFTFGFAGTGGGKTCLIPLWLYFKAALKPKGRFLVVSPTSKIFQDSQLKKHILDTFQDTPLQGRWSPGDKVYYLGTGGEIVVKTVGDGADYQRLVGGQYDAAVADEVFFLSKEVWDELRRRGGQNDCPILAVTTPNANNWIYDIKATAEAGDKDYFIRQWGSAANPTYKKDHLDRERKIMSEAAYRRMYEGEFSAFEGLCYACFGDPSDASRYPVLEVRGNPLEALPSPPVRFFGGNDWGYKPDPAAMLMFAECEDGCIYVVDEVYGTEITPDVLAVKARELIDKWAARANSAYTEFLRGGKFIGFYSDTSRPEELKMFQRSGVPIRNKKVADIAAGIAIVDSWFRAGRLKVFSTCDNLIRELKAYQWDSDRKGGLKDKPLGKNDHACFVAGTKIATAEGLQPIEALNVGDLVWTRQGLKPVAFAAMSEPNAVTYTLELEDGRTLVGTADHPIWINNKGFVRMDEVSYLDSVTLFIGDRECLRQNPLGTKAESIVGIRKQDDKRIASTSNEAYQGANKGSGTYIVKSGLTITDRFQAATTSTTATKTQAITTLATLKPSAAKSIARSIGRQSGQKRLRIESSKRTKPLRNGIRLKTASNGIPNMQDSLGKPASLSVSNAKNAVENTIQSRSAAPTAFAPTLARRQPVDAPALTMSNGNASYAASPSLPTNTVRPKLATGIVRRVYVNKERAAVFNLTVDDAHEYFANGILVSNCDALRYAISSQKYGEQVTPVLASSLNASDIDKLEKEKLEQLGLLTAESMQRTKEMDEAERNKRLHEITWYDPND